MATRIPITKESGLGFEDRQKRIWDEMEADMDRRRKEWESEIEKMRKDFFMLRPEEGGRAGALGAAPSLPLGAGDRLGPRSRLLDTSSSAEESRGMVVKDDKGNPVFKVLFDVHEYRPEEVSVKMDANKVMVTARQEGHQGGSSVSREYSRQVVIPSNIDPLTLQCTMGPDGVLAVEAPIPAPCYTPLPDTATTLPIKTASPGPSNASSIPLQRSSSSSSTSSSTFQSSFPPGSRAGDQNLPTGFKPVSAPLQNSAQPSSSLLGGSSQQQKSTVRETSSSSSGFSKTSPPFQALSSQQGATTYSPPLKTASPSSAGRIGSPVVLSDPSGKFKLEIDIEDFKPEELTVKTQDKRVVVCAKREEKVGTRSSMRELSREHTIPESVDPLTIKAFFTDEGKLIIEAPYKDSGVQPQVSGR